MRLFVTQVTATDRGLSYGQRAESETLQLKP